MKKIIYLLLVAILFSCGDLEEMNLNPDSPTKVTPDFLATNIILNSTRRITGKWLLDDTWLMKSTAFTEHMEWYMYNKFGRNEPNNKGEFRHMPDLINAQKMIEMAEADESLPEGEKKAYLALNHFMRAYFFYGLTMELGDIPCSEALKGESEGIFSPKYDTQEMVFSIIIKDIQEAARLFGEATILNGDFVYNGDVARWQRASNSFALSVLNMLSEKQNVGDINVKTKFEEIAKRPLIDSEENSYRREYSSTKTSQWYPFYFEHQNFWSYPVFTSFFIDILKDLEDKRLFYYAEPAAKLSNIAVDSFDAYSGVNPIMEYGKIQAEFTEGLHSSLNKRYYRVPEGEPVKFVAYSETHFVLAEAALRGWATPLSAKEHYENGVRSTMLFTAKHTPEEYKHNVIIDEAYINSYLNNEAKFDSSKGLEQIILQKYIGSFVQVPFNSYYDYRRTGLPKLPINPETNMNEVKTQLPLRFMYPSSEYSQNRENVEEAVQRQFGGSDTPNDVMWLLK